MSDIIDVSSFMNLSSQIICEHTHIFLTPNIILFLSHINILVIPFILLFSSSFNLLYWFMVCFSFLCVISP